MPDEWLSLNKNHDNDDEDNNDVGGQSGSGDSAGLSYTSTTLGGSLTNLPVMLPDVETIADDETNLYLYILAAAVAAVVFIFVVVILIVSIRKQARDKKKTLSCDKSNLQTVKIQNEARSNSRNQHGQSSSPARLPEPHKHVRPKQDNDVTSPQDGCHNQTVHAVNIW